MSHERMKKSNNMPLTPELSREELELISWQGSKGIVRLELDTGKAVHFLDDGSSVPINGVFPQCMSGVIVTDEDSMARINNLIDAAKRREPNGSCGVWMEMPNGRRWCVMDYDLVPEKNGKVTHAIISMHDETELHEREQAYEKWREGLLSMFAENASYVEFNLNRGTMERQMGMPADSAAARSECTLAQFVDYACEHIIFEADREAYREFFDRERLLALFERNVTEDTLEYRDCGSGVQWMRANVQMTRYYGSGDVKAFIVYTNIDRQRSELERLARLASRDALTNILNRKALEDRISERLESAEPDQLSALYIIDLDDFKQINDRFGHQAGDETLKNVASVLNNTFRSGDIVGRLGGDEFMAYISGVTEPNAISRANRLINELQFAVQNASLSASIGLALCLGKAEFSALYRGADIALYKSKGMGKKRCTVYRHSNQQEAEPDDVNEIEESGIIQLQTLLEYMDGGVIIVEVRDNDVSEVYVSPSYYSTMPSAPGVDRDKERALFNRIRDEHKPMVLNALTRTADTGVATDTIYQVNTGDNEWHHLRAARLPGTWSVPRIIGVVTDVSELKRSSSQLEAIAVHATVGIAMFELSADNAQATFVNPKLQEMLGMDIESINRSPGAADRLTGGERYRRSGQSEYEGVCEGDTFEFICRGTDISNMSGELYIQARGVHIYDNTDSAVVLIMYTDITREREMEENLRMAEERYRIAASQTGMFIWEVDIAARTTRQINAHRENAAFADEFYTNSPDSLLAGGLIHPDSEQIVKAMYGDIYAGRESDEYVIRRRDGSGNYVWARARYTLVRAADGSARHAVGVSEVMPNIDVELRELRRTWNFSGLIEDLLRATFHINLTRDIVDYAHINELQPEDYANISNLEDCKKMLAMIMAKDDESKAILDGITVDWLMGLFREGRRTHMFEFRTETESGIGWNNLFFDLLRDPLSGDVWAFAYLRDISGKKVNESQMEIPPNYDTVTHLYTYATVREAIRAYVANTDPKSRIVVSVLDLIGMTGVMRTQGMNEASRVLNLVGRLFRLLVGDSAIFGHLTQSRFIVLHSGVESMENWRTSMGSIIERINDLLHKSEVSESVRLMCGYMTALNGEADCGVLIRKAAIACQAAVSSEMKILEYSEPEFESKTEDTDAAEVDKYHTPEMAELQKKYRTLELSYQRLANRYRMEQYDSGTGLNSFDGFCRTMRECLDTSDDEFILAACQIEQFATYCAVNGSQVGDSLLKSVAEALDGKAIAAARTDESGVMFLVRREGFDAAATHQMLKSFVEQRSAAFGLDIRMGVYNIPVENLSVSQICDQALAVLHVAGEGKLFIYDDQLKGRELDSHSETDRLAAALEREQIVPYFVPQTECLSGRIVGVDIVMYWAHPEKGLLAPDEYIHRFRHSDLSAQFREYVADRCCRFGYRMQEAGLSLPIHISSEGAGIDLCAPGFSKMLSRAAERYGIDRRLICPEVRENAYLLQPERLTDVVEKLHAAGFSVGVEDFGDGCSSITFLLDVSFDSVRLSERLVRRCLKDRSGKCMLSALLEAVNRMERTAIAMGVQSEAEAAALQELGCFRMQGRHMASPMSEECFIACISEGVDSPAREISSKYWYDFVGAALMLGDTGHAAEVLRDACDSRINGMIVFSADEHIIEYANDEACRIFSCQSVEEFRAISDSHLGSLVLPDDRAYLRERIELLSADHPWVHYECRANDAFGKVIWVKGVLRRVNKGNGELAIVCEFFDVTSYHSEEQEQLLSSYSETMMACFDEIIELNFEAQTITVRYSGYGNRMLGMARPLYETVDKLCQRHVVPEHSERLSEFIGQLHNAGTCQRMSIEYDLKGRDGKIHTILSRAVPINSTRYLLCNTDITDDKLVAERKEQEKLLSNLRRERKNYYFMVERLGSAIMEWDLTDGTCWSSDSCARYAINGKSGASTEGMMSSGVHSEDMVSFAMFMSKLEVSDDYADTTLRMKMADGSYRWTKLTGEAVRDRNGIPVRMLVSLTDVDDEIRSRQEIADYTSRSVAFIENIPGGVLIANISRDETVGSANGCFCSMIGYTSQQVTDIIHKRWTDIVTPGDRHWIEGEIRRLVAGRQKQIDVICSLRHREGYDVPIRVLAALISQDEASTSIAFICVDEQIEAE